MKASRQHTDPRATSHLASADAPASRKAEGHGFVWGGGRLVLGITQMVFSLATVIAFLYGGLSNATTVCFLVASAATLLSRFLYRGRTKPGGG